MTRDELELLTDIRASFTLYLAFRLSDSGEDAKVKGTRKVGGAKKGKGRERESLDPPPLLTKSLVKAMFINFLLLTLIVCLLSGDQHSTYCSQRDQVIPVNVIFENSMLSFLYHCISITVQFCMVQDNARIHTVNMCSFFKTVA